MARKKQAAEAENHERWLVSYADFITLLFAFFVVMFASSQTDKAKAQAVSDSVKEALEKGGVQAAVHEILGGTVDEKGKGNAQMKGPGGSQARNVPNPSQIAELLPSLHFLTVELEKEIKAGKIEVHMEGRGLVISLKQAAYFPSGGDAVASESANSIEKIATVIRGIPNQVRLEGHTDSVPIHTDRFRSNWELSAARSIAMLELLSTKYQIPHQRFGIAGYADTVPIAPNDSEENRARNRRVDIVLLNQAVALKGAESPEPTPRPAGVHDKKPSPLDPAHKK